MDTTAASLEEQLNTALADLETERQRTRAANNKAGTAERKLAQALRGSGWRGPEGPLAR